MAAGAGAAEGVGVAAGCWRIAGFGTGKVLVGAFWFMKTAKLSVRRVRLSVSSAFSHSKLVLLRSLPTKALVPAALYCSPEMVAPLLSMWETLRWPLTISVCSMA